METILKLPVMNERGPDRKAGQKVDACGRKLFSVLIFWLLLYQDKSNSPPAAIERADV
jgi:hypothetical protein